MAFSGAITVQQNTGSPSQFVVTDSSTGSDPAITSRRIYLYKADNTNLVPTGTTTSYISWPIANGPITIDVLSIDMALMITVQWLVGAVVTYSYTNYYQFPANTKTFMYGLSVDQSSNPTIISATDYFSNKAKMYTFLSDAANAIAYGPDIVKAQLAFNLAYQMIINQQLYF